MSSGTEYLYVKIENGYVYGESSRFETTPQFTKYSESNSSVHNGNKLKYDGKKFYFNLEGHTIQLSFDEDGFEAEDLTHSDGEELWFWKNHFDNIEF